MKDKGSNRESSQERGHERDIRPEEKKTGTRPNQGRESSGTSRGQ